MAQGKGKESMIRYSCLGGGYKVLYLPMLPPMLPRYELPTLPPSASALRTPYATSLCFPMLPPYASTRYHHVLPTLATNLCYQHISTALRCPYALCACVSCLCARWAICLRGFATGACVGGAGVRRGCQGGTKAPIWFYETWIWPYEAATRCPVPVLARPTGLLGVPYEVSGTDEIMAVHFDTASAQ
eukprot:3247125-Rhodomonas_salina.3